MAKRRRRRRITTWMYSFIRRLRTMFGANPVTVPVAVTDLSATANLDGTITVSWTLPEGATHVRVRYNVDQAAAPTEVYLGINLGLIEGTSVVLTGVEYGATYRFSAWAYNEGGYSDDADTASATGPFNPSAYGTGLNLWIDARRETPVADDATLVPHDQTGTQTITTATNAPHYRTAGNGIGAVAAFEGYRTTDATARGALIGAAVNLEGAGGLTQATLLQCNDVDTGSQTVFSKWDSGNANRGYMLTKTTGNYIFFVSPDGTATVQVQTSSVDDTDIHGMVSVWKPSTHLQVYVDGAQEGETTASVPAALFDSAIEENRFMLARGPASDPYRGKVAIHLSWPDALSRTACELLSDHLAAIGGV